MTRATYRCPLHRCSVQSDRSQRARAVTDALEPCAEAAARHAAGA